MCVQLIRLLAFLLTDAMICARLIFWCAQKSRVHNSTYSGPKTILHAATKLYVLYYDMYEMPRIYVYNKLMALEFCGRLSCNFL